MTTQPDPLNTTPWSPLEQDWGEGETVKVVSGSTSGEPGEVGPVRTPRKSSDGPALLIHKPSADDHHDIAVRAMVDQVRLAYDALSLPKTGAQAWAYSINYWDDVRDELYEAVARISHALDLIDIHENG